MILLYLALILLLATLHLLVRWRAAALERRYVRTAGEADKLVKLSGQRGGTNKADPAAAARQQYELALLTLRRDRTEARYARWQGFAERLANWRKGLTAYKGKLLPYAVGVLDVAGVVVLLHTFSVGGTEVRSLLGL